MIYIVAGNYKQAQGYARKHGIYPKSWDFVETADKLLGASGSVAFTGTFYERHDKFDVAAAVELGVEQQRLTRIDDG